MILYEKISRIQEEFPKLETIYEVKSFLRKKEHTLSMTFFASKFYSLEWNITKKSGLPALQLSIKTTVSDFLSGAEPICSHHFTSIPTNSKEVFEQKKILGIFIDAFQSSLDSLKKLQNSKEESS